MHRHIKTWLITPVLVAPLLVFAGPHGGNSGNGHGDHGNSGDSGNRGGHGGHGNSGNEGNEGNEGDDQGGGPDNSGNRDNGHGRDMTGGPGNGGGSGNGAGGSDDSGDGQTAGVGRGNSQGPAHANPQASISVCKHQASATHSVLGVYCGNGVVAAVNPKSGVTSFTQAGLNNTPTPSTTPGTSGERSRAAATERTRDPANDSSQPLP